MTSKQYIKQVNDVMLEQLKRVSSSKEAAKELIDSLGIRHLLVPIEKGKRKKNQKKNHIDIDASDKGKPALKIYTAN